MLLLSKFYLSPDGHESVGSVVSPDFIAHQRFILRERSRVSAVEVYVNYQCSTVSPLMYIYSDKNNKPDSLVAQLYCTDEANERGWVRYVSANRILLPSNRYWIAIGFSKNQLARLLPDSSFQLTWYGSRGSPYTGENDALSYKISQAEWISQDSDLFFRVLGSQVTE